MRVLHFGIPAIRQIDTLSNVWLEVHFRHLEVRIWFTKKDGRQWSYRRTSRSSGLRPIIVQHLQGELFQRLWTVFLKHESP